MSLPPNRAIGSPTLGHAVGSEADERASSLLDRVFRFIDRQPKPRVDSAQLQLQIATPSSVSTPSTSTLAKVLDDSVEQAKDDPEKSERKRIVTMMEGVEAYCSDDGAILAKSHLSLYGFTGAITLPQNLTVFGDLEVILCSGLTHLPENLKVGGNLTLDGCTGLTGSLPENLRVRGGNLKMTRMNLNNVPENLEKVQGLRRVNLYDNNIQALPDRLGQLPANTALIVEGNPIPAAEIARFRAEFPHITLRADQGVRAGQGAVNVHTQQVVSHFETLYRTLCQILCENNNALISISDTKDSLQAAADKYKKPDAKAGIKYMLVDQSTISVMDFTGDVTSGKVLTSAWTLIQSQATQEDRDNGTENLVNHLADAKGLCSTRHAEEVLLALEDSYGRTLKQTAAEAKCVRSDVDAVDEPKRQLTTTEVMDHFLNDIKVFVNKLCVENDAISNEELLEKLKKNLYSELAPKHVAVKSLKTTVADVIKYLAEDWSTFVEDLKESN